MAPTSQEQDKLEEGLKNLNLTNEELTKFEKAFKDPEFLKLFEEYAREVSDPKVKAETDQYLRQLEQQGRAEDVYGKGVQLITPKAALVLKSKVVGGTDAAPSAGSGTTPSTAAPGAGGTGGKKEGPALSVGQKVFINVSTSDKVARHSLTEGKDAGGRPGRQLSIPLVLGPVRQGTDKEGKPAPVYDIVVHPEMVEFANSNAQVMASLAETALEHVERVAQCRLSRGWRRLNLRFKATEGCAEPPVQCIRTAEGGGEPVGGRLRPRPDVPGVDVPGARTAPVSSAAGAGAGAAAAAGSATTAADAGSKGPASRSTFSFDRSKDTASKSEVEIKDHAQAGYRHPDGAVTPEWVLVRRGQADLAAAWKDAGRGLALDTEVPKELVVRVTLPEVASAAAVDLDVGERRLTLKVPARYFLDVALPYAVDEGKGKAKFDKARKQLEITLPVVPPPAPPPRPSVASAGGPPLVQEHLSGTTVESSKWDAADATAPPAAAADETTEAAGTQLTPSQPAGAEAASTSGSGVQDSQPQQRAEAAEVSEAAPLTDNERRWRELHTRREAEQTEELADPGAAAAEPSQAADRSGRGSSPADATAAGGGDGDGDGAAAAAAAAAAEGATGGGTAANGSVGQPEPTVLLQPRLKRDLAMELD